MSNYQKRMEKLLEAISREGLDGIYITNLTNVKYLTGFTGSAGQVLILEESSHFFSDTRYDVQSREQVKNCIIHMIDDGYVPCIARSGLVKPGMKIGFESDQISYKLFNMLNTAFPESQFLPTEGLVELIAAVKDMDEINALKMAIEITDQVFDDILPYLKPGAIEKQVAARISYMFKMHGADGDSYDPIIASGWLSALPHATPTDRAFEKGDFVVMDFGALYNGYHADMTRTVVIGEASDRHREIYSIVLESQLAGIRAAKAGITGAQLDKACRDVIEAGGYGKEFCHSTGHGIGLEVHTYPRISKLNTKPLLENYVVTIEPGIYIPGWGGVRIEDDCWIRKDNCTPLNSSTKELLVLGAH